MTKFKSYTEKYHHIQIMRSKYIFFANLVMLSMMSVVTANNVFFEEQGILAPNDGTFDVNIEFDLQIQVNSFEEAKKLTHSFLEAPIMKLFETACHQNHTKYEKRVQKLNTKLMNGLQKIRNELKGIAYHFDGEFREVPQSTSITTDHRQKRDFGISNAFSV